MIRSERKPKAQSAFLTLKRVKGATSENAKQVRSLSEAEKAAGRRFLSIEASTDPKSSLHKRMQSSRG